MKKIAIFVLEVAFLLGITGCQAFKESSDNGIYPFFVAKVIEIEESTILVEVTNRGNCGVSEGDQIRISTEKLSAVLMDNISMIEQNFIRVEFDGNIMETFPLQIGKIYRIDGTDQNGLSIE